MQTAVWLLLALCACRASGDVGAETAPEPAEARFVREALPSLTVEIARVEAEVAERVRRHEALAATLEDAGQTPARSAPFQVQARVLDDTRRWAAHLQAARARAVAAWALARWRDGGGDDPVLAAAVHEAEAIARAGRPARAFVPRKEAHAARAAVQAEGPEPLAAAPAVSSARTPAAAEDARRASEDASAPEPAPRAPPRTHWTPSSSPLLVPGASSSSGAR